MNNLFQDRCLLSTKKIIDAILAEHVDEILLYCDRFNLRKIVWEYILTHDLKNLFVWFRETKFCRRFCAVRKAM